MQSNQFLRKIDTIRVLNIFHPAVLCSVWCSGRHYPSGVLEHEKNLFSSGFLSPLAAHQTIFKSFFCLSEDLSSLSLVKISGALQMKIEV